MPALLLVFCGTGIASEDVATPHEPSRNSVLWADLPSEVLAALRDTEPSTAGSPGSLLEAIYEAGEPRELDTGALIVRTDPRWFARTPEQRPNGPLVELRRWPGDTVIALYAVGPERDPTVDEPPVPGVRWVVQPNPARTGWRGAVVSEGGERPALWIEREVGPGLPHLGSLVLPGDAGLGQAAIPGLTEEALFVLSRIELREETWKKLPTVPKGRPLIVPEWGDAPGDRNEREHPWQIAVGRGFTLGLPPGTRGCRLDVGVRAPVEISGGVLWMRGRFRDLEERLVVVGDGSRAGYVARVETPAPIWISGGLPPVGAPEAVSIASFPFNLAAKRAAARRVTAGRWLEPGFSGTWLVFRLAFREDGYEIGLPVVEGWQSPSLFWIAATWRAADQPPAPPPIGPEQRFDIRFDPSIPSDQVFTWHVGRLHLPGLLMTVAKGWSPSPETHSARGFPLSFHDSTGKELATLTRVAPEAVAGFIRSHGEWVEHDRPGRHDARRVLHDERGAHLFIAEEGFAFYFEPSPVLREHSVALPGGSVSLTLLWQLMMQSVLLQPSEPQVGD